MSPVDILEIPKQIGSNEPTLSGSVSLQLKGAKIVAEDQALEIEDSPTTPSMLRKLHRTEDGSYRFPGEWNVRPTQFFVLYDYLHSTK